jgi:hypothetical protein
VKNFIELAKDWFGLDLSTHNLYLMLIGFVGAPGTGGPSTRAAATSCRWRARPSGCAFALGAEDHGWVAIRREGPAALREHEAKGFKGGASSSSNAMSIESRRQREQPDRADFIRAPGSVAAFGRMPPGLTGPSCRASDRSSCA